MSNNTPRTPNGDLVVDVARSRFSDLWKNEDYWAIWLGVLVLVFGLVVFFNNAPESMDAKIASANAY